MKLFFTLLIFFFSSFSFAQDGSLDTSFGDGGVMHLPISDGQELISDFTILPSGELFITGRSYIPNIQQLEHFIFSLNDDGSINSNFGNNGILLSSEVAYLNIYIQEINQRILITLNDSRVLALRYDGSTDDTFANNGLLSIGTSDDRVLSVELLADESFLTIRRNKTNDTDYIVQSKFTAEGTLDTTFGNDGEVFFPFEVPSSLSQNVITQRDNAGRLLVLYSKNDPILYTQYLKRFLPDGSLDSSFGTQGIVEITSIAVEGHLSVLDSDEILVGLIVYDTAIFQNLQRTFKFSDQGTPITSFGTLGVLDHRMTLMQQDEQFFGDGAFIDDEGGFQLDYQKITPLGAVDPSFQFEGYFQNFGSAQLKIDNEDRLVIAASTPWYDFYEKAMILRYNNSTLSLPENNPTTSKVYPNPSNGMYTLLLPQENVNYYVYDSTGKQIKKGTFTNLKNSLDLTKLQSGIYFLTIYGITQKLIKL